MDAETRRWLERLERGYSDLDGRVRMIEDTNRGVELAKQVLKDAGANSSIRWQHFRDWATLGVASCAFLVAAVVAWQQLFG